MYTLLPIPNAHKKHNCRGRLFTRLDAGISNMENPPHQDVPLKISPWRPGINSNGFGHVFRYISTKIDTQP